MLYGEYNYGLRIIMENFKNYFKKGKWSTGSIREVIHGIERIKSIEPPLSFAILGDSRDGKKVYTELIQRILERKPNFIVHLGIWSPYLIRKVG
jgi:hypothetical protein